MSPKPGRRKAKRDGQPPYHRRSGVLWRPSQLGVPRAPQYGRQWPWSPSWLNDGGDDAPLSPRGQAIFRYSLLGIFVAFVLLVLVTAAGH